MYLARLVVEEESNRGLALHCLWPYPHGHESCVSKVFVKNAALNHLTFIRPDLSCFYLKGVLVVREIFFPCLVYQILQRLILVKLDDFCYYFVRLWALSFQAVIHLGVDFIVPVKVVLSLVGLSIPFRFENEVGILEILFGGFVEEAALCVVILDDNDAFL